MLIACVILCALVCTACQSSKADEKIETAIDQGDYALAVSLLKKQKHVAKNTILENLNLSLLMHWAEQYDKSSALMNPTDNLLMESAQLNLARSFGTAVLNDNSATYAGTVYEYLYINAFNALNYYNAGKLELPEPEPENAQAGHGTDYREDDPGLTRDCSYYEKNAMAEVPG